MSSQRNANPKITARPVTDDRGLGALITDYISLLEEDPQDWQRGKSEFTHSLLFQPIRRMKAIYPELLREDPRMALATFERTLEQIGHNWTSFDGIQDAEHGRQEFLDTWMGTSYPEGKDPLDVAVVMAKVQPLQFPTKRRITTKYQDYLTIAYFLWELRGGRVIVLPQERLAKILQVDQTRVSDYCRTAQMDGYLDRKGRYNKEQKRADSFVFKLPVNVCPLPRQVSC